LPSKYQRRIKIVSPTQVLHRYTNLVKEIEDIHGEDIKANTLAKYQGLGLIHFVRTVSPDLPLPRHLYPAAAEFEKISKGERVKLLLNLPPGFVKSTFFFYACTWLLIQNPKLRIIFLSSTQDLANRESRKVRELATNCGVDIATTNVNGWQTKQGGYFLSRGLESVTNGWRGDVIIGDDLIPGPAEAESSKFRDDLMDRITTVLGPRGLPQTSVIFGGTRFHPDDHYARLKEKVGWKSISLPAILPNGQSLWEEMWSTKKLLSLMPEGLVNEYSWLALYQQTPSLRGQSLFKDVHYYDLKDTPSDGFRISIGADTAYAAKKTSDYSTACVLREKGGVYYVTDFYRARVEAPAFGKVLKELSDANGSPGIHTYIGGQEKAVLDYFQRDHNLRIRAKQATEDKFSRAQRCAAMWNAGKLLLPSKARWLNDVVGEILSFSGTNKDVHDDTVDALVAAFDALARRRSGTLDGDVYL
jgi:predicted phage terminase large subunit-like protein